MPIFWETGTPEIRPAERPTSLFSQEQRQKLEQRGYLIYTLTGQSLASLRERGNSFAFKWHEGKDFEKRRSYRTEVAVNPNHVFLEDSKHKTFDEQQAMVDTFGKKLSREVNDVTAVLGDAPDYAELAFMHFKATGKALFEEGSTRTTTDTGGSCVAYVCSDSDGSVEVRSRIRNDREDNILAAPLVVPTAAVKR